MRVARFCRRFLGSQVVDNFVTTGEMIMGRVFELRAIGSFDGIEDENMPWSMWLPYRQVRSERFVCEETKEVWQRIFGVSVLCEDDDNPEDDLIDDFEEVPEGLICWQGKKGTVPEVGDVLRIVGPRRNVIFEEVISGDVTLHGRKYMSAEKQADFAMDLVRDLEQDVKKVLTGGDDGYFDYQRLRENSAGSSEVQERVPISLRGLNFELVLDEFSVASETIWNKYRYEDGKLVSTPHSVSPGDKWYQARIYAGDNGKDTFPASWGFVAGNQKDYISVCWGVGGAAEAAVKVQGVLDNLREPVDSLLEKASARSAASAEARNVELDHELGK